MREAMARAEVGDDVYGEDPTVNRLQAYAADLLGKEAGLFVPSGTMANLIAFLAQARAGETVILSREAHPFHYEGGNMAAFGGLLTRTVSSELGIMTAPAVEAEVVHIDDPHFSHTTLVSIENTVNRGSGAMYTPEDVAAIGKVCQRHGMRLHCDGARLFNAAVAQGIAARDLVAPCDTVSFCLSKGLGAPAGSLLVGDRATLKRALKLRKMLGGGMRQAGVLAAAGLHALEHHMAGLTDDHRRTREFRTRLEAEGVQFSMPSPTNMVYIRVPEPITVTAALYEAGVQVLPHDVNAIRAVFHRDITDDDLEAAVAACLRVLMQNG
jgi:threonine aldolase